MPAESHDLELRRSSSAAWDIEAGKLPQVVRLTEKHPGLLQEIMDTRVWILWIALVFFFLGETSPYYPTACSCLPHAWGASSEISRVWTWKHDIKTGGSIPCTSMHRHILSWELISCEFHSHTTTNNGGSEPAELKFTLHAEKAVYSHGRGLEMAAAY